MPTALEEFTANYGGDIVTIAADEWVCPTHELLRRFPARFSGDPSSRARRSGTSEAVWRAAVPSCTRRAAGVPELRYTVELTKSAWRDLDDAVGDFDGYEVGGPLLGHIAGDRIVVEHVGRQAPGRDRSSTSTEIPVERSLELARSLGKDFLGDWHVHPGKDSGTPSPNDERRTTNEHGRAWARAATCGSA